MLDLSEALPGRGAEQPARVGARVREAGQGGAGRPRAEGGHHAVLEAAGGRVSLLGGGDGDEFDQELSVGLADRAGAT